MVRIGSTDQTTVSELFPPPITFFLFLTVVTGSHKAAVSSAVTRIEVLIEGFRKKQPFTHFLSFPLNDSKIQEGFLSFKDEVLQQCSEVL